MTPTEATAILRQFNDWRRGHHDEQPDPRVRAILAWTVRGQWNGAT